ncbi:MAG: hypothetical protein AAGI38_21870 [Bacteroidota bacterium]
MNPKFSVLFVIFLIGTLHFATAQSATISPERKQAIDSLALEKVRDLSKYITIIGSKTTLVSEAARVMDRVEELFSPGSQIAVSSLYRKKLKYYGVREYCVHLNTLNYDQVKISWFNIHYVSDLELQPDGRWVGIITIYQKFEGINDDGLSYKDVTKKDITIYVERKQQQISGRIINFWDVLLGDIQVAETRRL